jgi:ATP-dependent DNA helicase RecG
MKSSIQKLQKFFKLEAERGYDDRAVVGGLERMLGPWEAEARVDGLEEELIAAVVTRLRDYHRLSPTSRQEALQGLWRRLQRGAEVENTPAPTVDEEQAAEPALSLETEEVEIDIEVDVETVEPGEEAAEESEEEPEPAIVEGQTTSVPGLRPSVYSPPAPTSISPPASPSAALQARVTVLQGVGPRHGQTLERLGLQTLGDLLYYFPRRYDDYSRLKPVNRLWYGDEVTVVGTVQNISNRSIRSGRMTITEAVVSDGTGALRVTWFNQPWITKRIRGGMQVVLSGKIDQYLGRLVVNNPEIEPLEQQNLSTNRIVPVYPLTANITQRWLRRLMHQVVTYWSPRVQDPLPQDLRQSASLIDLPAALIQAHFPDSFDQLKAARHRLAFDEIFLLQLGLLRQKQNWQERTGRILETPEDWLVEQLARLPFVLTSAQERALAEVRADLVSGHPMNRLLQGDVGSGKTVIAALAIAMVARHGFQSALMAPTSILAEQHYRNLLDLLGGEGGLLQPDQIRLLVGSTPEADKRAIREGLVSGEILLVIGTHALIEDPVGFANLQLTIVDEQHRFGVEQRAALRNKGENPHLMVMTATPIPRSLALTVYGDLDLSVMDEMPPGRQEISTHVLLPRERERAYSLIRSQLAQGRQAFIIYPLVEEGSPEPRDGDENGARAAVEEHRRLQVEIFPDARLGLLHGRMKADEKDEVMTRFRDGKVQILVSTSVVEVGVDVSNATVMLIEGANRFGLAQLHQFRGRVGRGSEKSFCLLVPESEDSAENERLSAMVETNDGFILAERDLEQRGPGDFLGTRQAGYGSELRLASLTDVRLIEKARQFAQAVFQKDPDLQLAEHQVLANVLDRSWYAEEQAARGDIS